MSGFRRALIAFIHMPRRYHGLLVGCFFWLFWMIFGFWRTLLLVVLGLVGYIVGRVLEEHQSWRDLLEKLLTDRFTE